MRKSQVFIVLFVVLAVILMPITAFAADITNALWKGDIRVTNSSNSTASSVSVNCSINSASLIDNGFASANFSDVAILYNDADVAFMPSANASYPWCVWVPSIGGNTYTSYDLYTGNATGGEIRYFPAAGGMATTDSPSMELGDNFTIEQKGWVDTSNPAIEDFTTYTEVDASGNLTVTANRATGVDIDRDMSVYLYKDMGVAYFDALDIDFEIYLDSNSLNTSLAGIASANVTGDMSAFGTTEIGVYINKDAANTLTLYRGKISVADSYAPAVDTPYYCTLYREAGSDSANCTIYSDSLRANLLDTLVVAGYGTTKWRYIYGFISYDVPITGKDWDGYIQDLNLGGNPNPLLVDKPNAFQTYVSAPGNITSATTSVAVTATGITSGERKVITTADSANLTIYVYDASDVLIDSDTIALTANVTDTVNDWTFCQNNVIPYLEYQAISVNGTQVQYIDWEYDTTFQDSSAFDNDAAPTFRTDSSDADVSAELISFSPVNESKVSTFTLASTYAILTGTPDTPGGMFVDGDYSKLPAAPINAILDEADVPRAAWWLPFLFLGICVIGFIVYGATTMVRGPTGKLREGQIDGSLLIMFIVMEAFLAALGKMGPIPYWPTFLFPIAGIAIILSRKHFSWG